MKNFIVLAIACFLASAATAQLPQYFIWGNGGRLLGGRNFGDARISYKIQVIYHPGDFPAAPAGQFTCIYLRLIKPRASKDSPAIYYDWRIRMGTTNLNGFKNSADSFITELATVVDIDTFLIPNGDSSGAWVRMPLVNTSFRYDRMSNFVVEITAGPDGPINGFDLSSATYDPANNRQLNNTTPKGSPMPAVGGSSKSILDFGFDIIPVGIKDAANIRSFGLFPNPANGHFVVSFEAKKPVKQVRITLTNVLGQAVQQAQFAEGGASFFREIPLRDIPKGIYSVAIEADGERLVRRLIVE